jgi:hypothetical protein
VIQPKRLALVPLLALGVGGMSVSAAHAATGPLSADAVGALAVASCQLDPAAPLTLAQMNPVVVGEADVEVVPGEITVHVVRADVSTSAGDVQQCTFGVLHRDALLAQVQYLGVASLTRVDTLAGTSYGVSTGVAIGNMGKSSPVDPTTEVSLGGFLTPLANAVEDPTYTVSLNRKSIEVVQIAVNRAEKNAAARLLRAQTKAAAKLQKKQVKAAGKAKHADKAIAAAERAYARRIAAAQKAYLRATAPKTVSRPVGHDHTVTGSVVALG